MPVSVTVNGVAYSFPVLGDEPPAVNWGPTVTSWAQSVSTNLLQKTGGTFTLTAEVNFGATFGLKAPYYKSSATNVASAGSVRLGNNEGIAWRNAANGGNIHWNLDASDLLESNGNVGALSFRTISANPASTGIFRLANAESIAWRNAANGADISLGVNPSDELVYTGAAGIQSAIFRSTGNVGNIGVFRLANGELVNWNANGGGNNYFIGLDTSNRFVFDNGSGFANEISTLNVSSAGASSVLRISTGNNAGAGNTGDIFITSGTSAAAASGSISIQTPGGSVTSGSLIFGTGAVSGVSGQLQFYTGNSSGSSSSGFSFTTGNGSVNSGSFSVTTGTAGTTRGTVNLNASEVVGVTTGFRGDYFSGTATVYAWPGAARVRIANAEGIAWLNAAASGIVSIVVTSSDAFDFSATLGGPAFSSKTAGVSTAGIFRMAKDDKITWPDGTGTGQAYMTNRTGDYFDYYGKQNATGGLTDGAASGQQLQPEYYASAPATVTRHNYHILYDPVVDGNTTITDACVFTFNAAAGTHKAVDSGTTKTTPGTVDAWMKININGTIYYVPAYTSKTT